MEEEKLVSTVLNVIEEEHSKASVAEDLKIEDGEVSLEKVIASKEKLRENTRRNVGAGGFGGH